jgi:Cys-tRNA(Pro)/Cys-tRNA(Cys) deacylase
VKKNKINYKLHEYSHDSRNKAYGLEASQKLGIEEARVFKTIVLDTNNDLAVGIIPVSSMVNIKQFAKALGVKKCLMADKNDVERSTGYVLGGVSPLGQKKRLKTIIDTSANNFDTIYISAGKRGLDIEINPSDLQKLLNGIFTDISQ